jgi:agmatine deiminase|tara:strand:- start:1183 stop:2220 length:1038 start_codon:yes stop_codon:yes gene_type:complete
MLKPIDLKFRMPAEWSEHECCWMQWPTATTPAGETPGWSNFNLENGRIAWANVANNIAKFEKLKMIVHPNDLASARDLLKSNTEILPLEINDAWCRDTGAIFLIDENNKLGGVDSNFNCWGYKVDYELDDKIANFMIDKTNAKYFKNDMVFEGGSINVDGEGTLITTEQCLLNKNRNPHLTKEKIEQNLKENFAVSKIIWLKYGIDEGTDGHVDNVACFIKPGTIMALTCYDKSDPYYDKLNDNLEILKSSTDSLGKRFNVIELEMSYERLIPDSNEPCSYINYYITNGGIILPSFDNQKADENAKKVVQSAFPDRKLISIAGLDILLGGGNVHCITQQQPRAKI